MRDGKLLSLPVPARHGDIIWYAIHVLGYESPVRGDEEQGFIAKDAEDKYQRAVGREEAYKIAVEYDQLIERAGGGPDLFSEDVWEGQFDRDMWLAWNKWTLVKDSRPVEGDPVWYFEENVGVFQGFYRGESEITGEYMFGGKHGSIDATHWMMPQIKEPDAPYVRHDYPSEYFPDPEDDELTSEGTNL